MPSAFKNAGYVVGIIGTIIIGALCTYTVHMLVSERHVTNTIKYNFILYCFYLTVVVVCRPIRLVNLAISIKLIKG